MEESVLHGRRRGLGSSPAPTPGAGDPRELSLKIMTAMIHSHKSWQVILERGTPRSRGAQLQPSSEERLPAPSVALACRVLTSLQEQQGPEGGETPPLGFSFMIQVGTREGSV